MSNAPVEQVFDCLIATLEDINSHARGTIMLTSEDGTYLHLVSAPSLPLTYREAIARVPIGADCGCCGTAAALGEAVLTENIATDPRWRGFAELALDNHLHACWSAPLRSAHGVGLGALAVYQTHVGNPVSAIQAPVDLIKLTAAFFAEREMEMEARRRTDRELRHALEAHEPRLIPH